MSYPSSPPSSQPEPTVPYGYPPRSAGGYPEPTNAQLQAQAYVQPYPPAVPPAVPTAVPGQRSRLAAGLFAIFLGTFGVHNFYLGRHGIAVGQLLMTILTLGLFAPLVAIWGLIEGILILTRSPTFARDARGIPLRD